MKRLLFFGTTLLGTLYFTSQPPRLAHARPTDTVSAPAADIVIDTPELLHSVERMNKKAELLNQKTERIKSNSRSLERETRLLQEIVSDSTPKADTVVVVHELDTNHVEPIKTTLWRRITGIFTKSK